MLRHLAIPWVEQKKPTDCFPVRRVSTDHFMAVPLLQVFLIGASLASNVTFILSLLVSLSSLGALGEAVLRDGFHSR